MFRDMLVLCFSTEQEKVFIYDWMMFYEVFKCSYGFVLMIQSKISAFHVE